MALCDFDKAGSAEIKDLALALTRVGTGKTAACGDLPGNGNDAHGKTGRAAAFLKHQSHRRNVKSRNALH